MEYALLLKLTGSQADAVNSKRSQYDPSYNKFGFPHTQLFSSFLVDSNMLESVCFTIDNVCRAAKSFTLPLDKWQIEQVEHTGMIEAQIMSQKCEQLEQLWLHLYQHLPAYITKTTSKYNPAVVLGRCAEEDWERVFYDHFNAMSFDIKKVSLARNYNGEFKIVREFRLGGGMPITYDRSSSSEDCSTVSRATSDSGFSLSSHANEAKIVPVLGRAVNPPIVQPAPQIRKQSTLETNFSEEPRREVASPKRAPAVPANRPTPCERPKKFVPLPARTRRRKKVAVLKEFSINEKEVSFVRRTRNVKVQVTQEKSVSSKKVSKKPLRENSIVSVVCVSKGFSKIVSNFEKIESAQHKVDVATDEKEQASSSEFNKAKKKLDDAKKMLSDAKKKSVSGWVRTDLLEDIPPTVMFASVPEDEYKPLQSENKRRECVTRLLKKQLASLGLVAKKIVVILMRNKVPMAFAEFQKHEEAQAAQSSYFNFIDSQGEAFPFRCQISRSYETAQRLKPKQSVKTPKKQPATVPKKQPVTVPKKQAAAEISEKVQKTELVRQVRQSRPKRSSRRGKGGFRVNQAVEAKFEGDWYTAHVRAVFRDHYEVVFDCCGPDVYRMNPEEICLRPVGLWEITDKVNVYDESGNKKVLASGTIVNGTSIENSNGSVDLISNAVARNGKVLKARKLTLRLGEEKGKFCARRVKPTLVIRDLPSNVGEADIEKVLGSLGASADANLSVNLVDCKPKRRKRKRTKNVQWFDRVVDSNVQKFAISKRPNSKPNSNKAQTKVENNLEWTNVCYVRFNNENDAAYMLSCLEENPTCFNRYEPVTVDWADSWTKAKNLF